MARKFSTNIDLLLNELQNAKVHVVASDPASPAEGQLYYNSTTKCLKFYNGTAWVALGYLNQMSATGAISANGQLISSVASPISGTDAATKEYVDNLAQGLDPKDSVLCATTGNITLSGAQTIDGIAVVAGDRVLVRAQTTASQNGIYVANASSWARAVEADTWAELVGAFVFVSRGTTWADTGWLCSVDAGGTLGTTAVSWVQFSAAGQITGANLTGAGSQSNSSIFSTKTGLNLNFRQLSTDTGSGVSITQNTNDLRFDVNSTNLHDSKGFAKFKKLTFAFVTDGASITLNHALALPAGTYDDLQIKIYETASKTEVEVDRAGTWDANNAYIAMNGGTTGAGYYTAIIQG